MENRTGQVVSIVYTPSDVPPKPPDNYARVAVESATLSADRGIDGDRKGNGRDRHLNIMSAETLEQLRSEGLKTGPGQMGEQLTVAGIAIDTLAPGTRLRIGNEVIVEVVEPRTGCARFEHIQGIPRSAVSGRLGVMARVVIGGTIRGGDSVTVQ
jgi:MOSC domain-containing protein YiiM